MAPRRNPEIAVVVLQEHGDWGSGSAKLAAQIITAYVNKKRKQEGNLLLQANKPSAPVEVGAVWSMPTPQERTHGRSRGNASGGDKADGLQVAGMQGGHFLVDTGSPFATPELASASFPSHPKDPPQEPVEKETAAVADLPTRFRRVIY
jgi:hypothetical protein